MNRKNIDAWIPIAIKEIQELQIRKRTDKKEKEWGNGIPSRYFGYVDSFGPTIIQSGLRRALTFYSEEDSQADRKEIASIIQNVLKKGDVLKPGDNLKGLINSMNDTNKFFWRNRILEAIIACKMALKLFHRVKPEEVKNKIEETT
ncbi:MAG: hypothetical protein COT43_06495 [Candidatus Marinimicrobia bacterium CG08_land_8_20_14_0_20_45_22]|nr:MAG: hypothetical protein COT43_06495 [Candidatus Marinimicrobia bacterium CG08_land_8_20_14_0_20_45_22]